MLNTSRSSLLSLCVAFSAAFNSRAMADGPLPVAGSVTASAPDSPLWQGQDLLGAYNQPQWVKSRRFATTRVHIQRDPWEVAVEQWGRGRLIKGDWSFRFQEEIEIGLPGRIQLDFYYDWTYDKVLKSDFLDYAAEIRWGLADWGAIWGNPALYFEYKWTDGDRGGDVIEPKLLFGGETAQGDQWGLNFVYEREISGPEEAEEFQITGGIAHELNKHFSVGVEGKFVNETIEGSRSSAEHKFLMGPSVQWRPCPRSHVDLVVLMGITEAAPDVEAWFVGGIEFGRAGGNKETHAPVSGRR